MASVGDHYAAHLGPLYEWMLGGFEAALARSAAELDALRINGRADGRVTDHLSGHAGTAVDLGAGIGQHAIALARRGYAVAAIDSDARLLDALKSRIGSLPIKAIHADLLDFQIHLQQPADVILCMGDTLTHLPDLVAAEDLLCAVAGSLSEGGRFIATFRDYVTAPLTAEQRFIPVRSDAQRIFTCFLEYKEDSVVVHDLLHEQQQGRWVQRVSSYPKLRIAPDWVVKKLQEHELDVHIQPGVAGMVCVTATKQGAG